jgi:hypothetical protein
MLLPRRPDIAGKKPIGRSVDEAADQRLVQINVAAEVPERTAID